MLTPKHERYSNAQIDFASNKIEFLCWQIEPKLYQKLPKLRIFMLTVVHDGSPPTEVDERCCVCRSFTKYWFAKLDVALCQACAAVTKQKDLPTKTEWVAKENGLVPRRYP